jgi:glycosyltransferase involved in cell wall biosynthesis
MKVVMFCGKYRPVVGGAERQADKLARALAQRGLDVLVITPLRVPGSAMLETTDGITVRRFRFSETRIRRLADPWFWGQIFYQVWRHSAGADVLHCHILGLETIAAAMAARARGIPAIVKVSSSGTGSVLDVLRTRKIGRAAARLSKHVFSAFVATTEYMLREVQADRIGVGKAVLIPNGVEMRPYRIRNPPVHKFLYLGRVSIRCNRDFSGLVKAFERTFDSCPQAQLAVVGDGDMRETLREMASSSRAALQIQIVGQGDPDQWLGWADCLVLPSRQEGLSNALLEAMAAALPCITYDIPPNREVLEDGKCGVLTPVDDWQALAEAMTTLAGDPLRATSLGRAAWERVRDRYGIESTAERHVALYSDIVSR